MSSPLSAPSASSSAIPPSLLALGALPFGHFKPPLVLARFHLYRLLSVLNALFYLASFVDSFHFLTIFSLKNHLKLFILLPLFLADAMIRFSSNFGFWSSGLLALPGDCAAAIHYQLHILIPRQ